MPQFRIEISPDDHKNAPYKPPLRQSSTEDAELQPQLKCVLRNGWIRPSSSHYGCPVLFVPKQDGSLRICIDYCTINHITKKERYSLPHIEELVQLLGGLLYLSKIDIVTGYHQMRMYVGDQQNTACSMKYSLYQWMVLPFGLTNSPDQFMQVMN